jgi:hypothetical protein
VIAQLTEKELGSSASNWTRRHLFAYRLLIDRNEARLLDILAEHHDEDCALCNKEEGDEDEEDEDECAQTLNWAKTKRLIGRNPSKLGERSEGQLRRRPQGSFWVALSRVVRRETLDPRLSSQRPKTASKRAPGMVNSAIAIEGSSPPPSSAESTESRREYDPSDESEDLDEDEHDEWRTKGEGVTVHLVGCFLDYTLNKCLLQGERAVQAWPRMESNTATAWINGHRITAEDDGGVILMSPKGRGWETINPFIALLEAKRAFKDIAFDRSRRAHPIVSDETLAQCLSEVIIT